MELADYIAVAAWVASCAAALAGVAGLIWHGDFATSSFEPGPLDFHAGRSRVTRHACPMTAELLAAVLLPLAVLIDNATAPARRVA